MAANLWVLTGAPYWASYSMATLSLSQRMPAEVFNFYVLVLVGLLPVAGLDRTTLLAVAFVGVCTSTLAMNCWNWRLSRIESSRVGMF